MCVCVTAVFRRYHYCCRKKHAALFLCVPLTHKLYRSTQDTVLSSVSQEMITTTNYRLKRHRPNWAACEATQHTELTTRGSGEWRRSRSEDDWKHNHGTHRHNLAVCCLLPSSRLSLWLLASLGIGSCPQCEVSATSRVLLLLVSRAPTVKRSRDITAKKENVPWN